jgi:RimJ/RimL family protein N-acetyltransferase
VRRLERQAGEAAAGLVLAGGTRLAIRPLEPADRDGVRRLFALLSPRSRHQRFLAPKPDLTARELAVLTSIDHVGHEALAAVDELDGSLVAIVRYVRFPDRPGVAELAAEVADHLQGMGIAGALAELIVERARASGFTTLTATTLWDNAAARAGLSRLGFRARRSAGAVLEFELPLE